jgi:hypothetical protein
MTKTSELYRSLLKRQAEQLRNIARDLRDPNLRDLFERLGLDIAGGTEGQNRQGNLN